MIIDLPSDLYKSVRNNNNRIFIGHQRCRAFNILNVKPCFKCGRYYHKSGKCPEENKTTCLRCAGEHSTINCTIKEVKICTNCKYSNEKYGTSYNIKHYATDSQDCDIFKNKIKKWIQTIDYSVMPSFQRYQG